MAQAANPCLSIDGLGAVQDNGWEYWVKEIVRKTAAKDLLQGWDISVRSTFVLKKLVIQDATNPTNALVSGQLQPNRSGESKFADLIIVLPSLFEGGELQLSHPQPAADPHPILPNLDQHIKNLRETLFPWTSDASTDTTPFLVWVMRHHSYAAASNFGPGSLKGSDALLIRHLTPLATELRLKISFAHCQITTVEQFTAPVQSSSDREKRANRRHRDRFLYDLSESESESEEDEYDWEMTEGSCKTTMRTTMVDFSGVPIDVDPVESGLLSVLDLESVFEEEPDIERDLRESEQSTSYRPQATKTSVYNRTVVVLWPIGGYVDATVNIGDFSEYLIKRITPSTSSAPTSREAELVENFIASLAKPRREKQLEKAIQLLRMTAARWNDASLFLRILQGAAVDKKPHLLGVEGFVASYTDFGLDSMSEFFESAMRNDGSNAHRQAILAGLLQVQQDVVLTNLSPLDSTQIPWLMDIAVSRGGEFMRDVIFPQARDQNLDKLFWLELMRNLKEKIGAIPAASAEVAKCLISECVPEIVRSLPAFPVLYRHETEFRGSNEILQVLKLCVDHGTSHYLMPRGYYTDLSKSLQEYMQTGSPPSLLLAEAFRPFFIDAMCALLSPLPFVHANGASSLVSLHYLEAWDIMDTMDLAGGVAVFRQRVEASQIHLEGFDFDALRDLCKALLSRYKPVSPRPPNPDYNAAISALVRALIRAFDPVVFLRTVTDGYSLKSRGPTSAMMGLVKICYDVGAEDQLGDVLKRLFPVPMGSTKQRHIIEVLIPFVWALGGYLSGKGVKLSRSPFKQFMGSLIRDYAAKIMRQTFEPSPMDPRVLRNICACEDCATLTAFFLSDSQTTITFKKNKKAREHIERSIRSHFHDPRIDACIYPRGMTAKAFWTANSKTGNALLATLGDVGTQRRILGSKYDIFYAQITDEHYVWGL
ncbi:hypothetical protein C8R43DRAFT_1234008 [Mycena crocata]|nr:hypothetical protein C8R43DRAFT_1234008 [Mycena crocata]